MEYVERTGGWNYKLTLTNCETKVMFENMAIDVNHKDNDRHTSDLDSLFRDIGFDFPMPFKRGDILTHFKRDIPGIRPFVLSYITTWTSEVMLKKGFLENECPNRGDWESFDRNAKSELEYGDYTGISAIGTRTHDEIGTLYEDITHLLPIDLEYYEEPLEGLEKQLQVYSGYEKREIHAETLVNACFAIRMEEYSREANRICNIIYSEDVKEKIGLTLY